MIPPTADKRSLMKRSGCFLLHFPPTLSCQTLFILTHTLSLWFTLTASLIPSFHPPFLSSGPCNINHQHVRVAEKSQLFCLTSQPITDTRFMDKLRCAPFLKGMKKSSQPLCGRQHTTLFRFNTHPSTKVRACFVFFLLFFVDFDDWVSSAKHGGDRLRGSSALMGWVRWVRWVEKVGGWDGRIRWAAAAVRFRP